MVVATMISTGNEPTLQLIIELVFALEPAISNDDILTFGIAHFLKTLPKSIHGGSGGFPTLRTPTPTEAFRLSGVDHRNPSEKNKKPKIEVKPLCHLYLR